MNIGLDTPQHSTGAGREAGDRRKTQQCRLKHGHGVIRQYLADAEPGTPVAGEAPGSGYWIVDEIEAARCRPALIHAYKAKGVFGGINKLDGHGVQRPFGTEAREVIKQHLAHRPPFPRVMTEVLLRQYDFVDAQAQQTVKRRGSLVPVPAARQRLMTLPGIGQILSVGIARERGDVKRIATAEHLARHDAARARQRRPAALRSPVPGREPGLAMGLPRGRQLRLSESAGCSASPCQPAL